MTKTKFYGKYGISAIISDFADSPTRKEQCDKFKDADEVFIAREVDEWRSPE